MPQEISDELSFGQGAYLADLFEQTIKNGDSLEAYDEYLHNLADWIKPHLRNDPVLQIALTQMQDSNDAPYSVVGSSSEKQREKARKEIVTTLGDWLSWDDDSPAAQIKLEYRLRAMAKTIEESPEKPSYMKRMALDQEKLDLLKNVRVNPVSTFQYIKDQASRLFGDNKTQAEQNLQGAAGLTEVFRVNKISNNPKNILQ